MFANRGSAGVRFSKCVPHRHCIRTDTLLNVSPRAFRRLLLRRFCHFRGKHVTIQMSCRDRKLRFYICLSIVDLRWIENVQVELYRVVRVCMLSISLQLRQTTTSHVLDLIERTKCDSFLELVSL